MRLRCNLPLLLCSLTLLSLNPLLVQAAGGVPQAKPAHKQPLQAKPGAQAVVLPAAVLGRPYARQLPARGGDEALRFLLLSGDLEDAGLTLSPGGLLSGVPTRAGTLGFRAAVLSDTEGGRAATQHFSLTVMAAPQPRPLIPSDLPARTRSKRTPK